MSPKGTSTFSDVLDQDGVSVRDGHFDLVQIASLANPDHHQSLTVLTLDPLKTLQLRVYDQRPPEKEETTLQQS